MLYGKLYPISIHTNSHSFGKKIYLIYQLIYFPCLTVEAALLIFGFVRSGAKRDYYFRHVGLSVWSLGKNCSYSAERYGIWCLSASGKSVEKIQIRLKSKRITDSIHEELLTLILSHWVLHRMINNVENNFRKIKINLTGSIISFPKIIPFIWTCVKLCQGQTGHRWREYNTTYALCMLNNNARIQTHTHTPRI